MLSTKYIAVTFNFLEIIEELSAIVKICRDIRIVNDFSTRILINMNIIESEKMIINVNTLIIDSCKNIKVKFFAILKDLFINRITMCAVAITVSTHINMKISIQLREKAKLSDRNYMFYSKQIFNLKLEKEIFSHIVDVNFSKILAINNSVSVVIIFRRFRLDIIKKFEKNDCYMIFEHDAHFAAKN